MAERSDWKAAIQQQKRIDAEHERRQAKKEAPQEPDPPSDFDEAVRVLNGIQREMRTLKQHLRALQHEAEPAIDIIRNHAESIAARAKTADYRTASIEEAKRYGNS